MVPKQITKPERMSKMSTQSGILCTRVRLKVILSDLEIEKSFMARTRVQSVRAEFTFTVV